MYPTDTLALAARTHGGLVGMDAGAETGPYATVTDNPGTSRTVARQALAEQLFAANYPKLAGWIRRLVDDDETAHEIASEAFVRLLSKWSSIDKLDSPQGYPVSYTHLRAHETRHDIV